VISESPGFVSCIIHRKITQEICGCNTQDKLSRPDPVALLLQEISLGSSGDLHRFWTRRACYYKPTGPRSIFNIPLRTLAEVAITGAFGELKKGVME